MGEILVILCYVAFLLLGIALERNKRKHDG